MLLFPARGFRPQRPINEEELVHERSINRRKLASRRFRRKLGGFARGSRSTRENAPHIRTEHHRLPTKSGSTLRHLLCSLSSMASRAPDSVTFGPHDLSSNCAPVTSRHAQDLSARISITGLVHDARRWARQAGVGAQPVRWEISVPLPALRRRAWPREGTPPVEETYQQPQRLFLYKELTHGSSPAC